MLEHAVHSFYTRFYIHFVFYTAVTSLCWSNVHCTRGANQGEYGIQNFNIFQNGLSAAIFTTHKYILHHYSTIIENNTLIEIHNQATLGSSFIIQTINKKNQSLLKLGFCKFDMVTMGIIVLSQEHVICKSKTQTIQQYCWGETSVFAKQPAIFT